MIKKLLAMVLVLSMVFGVVGCGKQKVVIEENVQEEILEEVSEGEETAADVEAEAEETVEDVEAEAEAEEQPVQTPTDNETKKESTKPANKPAQSVQTSTTPTTSAPVNTPAQTETKVEACEHRYEPEYTEYDFIKHYVFGCNGCGYPLFTFQGNDAVNLPDLYSHPACYSEKLGGDCVGGGFHSESYTRGFCGICHDEVKYRQCMFTEMGKRCVKNEALGAYEHVEFNQNHFAYFKSCRCGRNSIYMSPSGEGKGMLFTKEICTECGDVKTYPQYN